MTDSQGIPAKIPTSDEIQNAFSRANPIMDRVGRAIHERYWRQVEADVTAAIAGTLEKKAAENRSSSLRHSMKNAATGVSVPLDVLKRYPQDAGRVLEEIITGLEVQTNPEELPWLNELRDAELAFFKAVKLILLGVNVSIPSAQPDERNQARA